MKASVKLRDGKQPPLVRVKLPLRILGLPISSGITLGSSQELGLHVSTHCGVGPCLKISFWPNLPTAPLSLLFKAGVGPWGSSAGTCLAMSAELKMPTSAAHQQPSLMIYLRPRLGDFGLLKQHAVAPTQAAAVPMKWEFLKGKLEDAVPVVSVLERARAFSSQGDACTIKVKEDDKKAEFLKGWSLIARSLLPLGSRMVASVRWRVGIPHDCIEKLVLEPHHRLVSSCLEMPYLRLDKVTLVETTAPAEMPPEEGDALGDEASKELSRVASMCSSMRRQLQLLTAENQVLWQTMEDVNNNLSRPVLGSASDLSQELRRALSVGTTN